MNIVRKLTILLGLGLTTSTLPAFGGVLPLTHHVYEVVRNATTQPVGRLPATQVMQLDVVLALRNPQGLTQFLKNLYDPDNPGYRRFLTVSQFTERFGPTQQDYDSVVEFAKAHGLAVVGGTHDGMDVQIRGPVAAIESAFHVTLGTYRHPTENRLFYSPDREPTADLPFALWHVSGLDNYSIAHPMVVGRDEYAKAHGIQPEQVVPQATSGSGPQASFLGSDMRAAYYGGTALTGAGQNLGLYELRGTDLTDLNTYYNNVGQTNKVPVTLLSTDGTSTSCTAAASCDDTEQTLDMTQALGMAPGLASLVVYVGSTDTAILGAMTTHNPLPTTIGCSWGWIPVDPATLNPYFEKMAAQGQTFFAAAGDDSTWGTSAVSGNWNQPWPADDPYVVSVGGTDLTTTGAGGAWQSETAWKDSGGGISPNGIAIPWWQGLPGVINSSNRGSTTLRNGPDVAANANWSFYVCADQTACTANYWGGTSFAAPMWAGYVALLNQQLAANAEPLAGFIDPMLYEIGLSPAYDTNFHDITSGASGSYTAVTGYDLVTGWGSPNGANLINALALKAVLASELNTAESKNAVYYLGFDGNLYQITWGGSQGWGSQQDTGTGGRPSVASGTGITAYVNTIYNGNEVFYLASVNGSLHIEQLWGPTLSATDLTVISQGSPRAVAPSSNPVGYIDPLAGTDNVFYIGTDHLVHALTWSAGNPWEESSSLDAINPPAAAVGSPLIGHMNTASEEVFYVGTNQHVYELWRWSKNFDGWHLTDVTVASGSNPVAAVGNPLAGFYDSTAGHDAVFYQGTNQHVYELVFSTSGWSSVDVTGNATPPTVGSALAAHVNSVAGNEEVFFLDSNQNVRELSAPSTNSSLWSETDVTTISGGAPLAFPGSPLATHVSTLDNTDHAFYLGEDRNVHELWSNGSWHFNDDSTSTNPAAAEAFP
jgi:hypothetical protein